MTLSNNIQKFASPFGEVWAVWGNNTVTIRVANRYENPITINRAHYDFWITFDLIDGRWVPHTYYQNSYADAYVMALSIMKAPYGRNDAPSSSARAKLLEWLKTLPLWLHQQTAFQNVGKANDLTYEIAILARETAKLQAELDEKMARLDAARAELAAIPTEN